MKKLKLGLEQLTVDSFDTSAPVRVNGTVFGEDCTCYTNCTCPGCPTCDHTQCDQESCMESCNGTCFGEATCDGGHTCNYTEYDKYCCP